MASRKKKSADEAISDLVEMMFDAEIQSEADADRFLNSVGSVPAVLVSEGAAFIDKIKADILREEARRKKSLFESLFGKIQSSSSVADKRTVIKEWISGHKPQLAIQFYRRLEELTDNDIEALDSEQKLLELWSGFDEES